MNPGIIVMLIAFAIAGLAFVFVALPIIREPMRMRDILQTGVPATAEILSIADSGSRYNHQMVAAIRLRVTPGGAASYETGTRSIVTALNSPGFQPGQRVSVKIDRDNPERVAIMGPLQ
jgi:hypothetical protein